MLLSSRISWVFVCLPTVFFFFFKMSDLSVGFCHIRLSLYLRLQRCRASVRMSERLFMTLTKGYKCKSVTTDEFWKGRRKIFSLSLPPVSFFFPAQVLQLCRGSFAWSSSWLARDIRCIWIKVGGVLRFYGSCKGKVWLLRPSGLRPSRPTMCSSLWTVFLFFFS